MVKRKIKISTVENVKRFNSAATKQMFDIDIASGERYIIDGKSIMGIYSLDLSKTLDLVCHTDDEAVAEAFFDEIRDMLA